MKFPNNFLWGTATAAHQIEGDNINNDWWEAEQEGRIPHKSGKACDSYNRYEEDFDLAKQMNNNAHRFSIEWSRIEPEEGQFDQKEIEHYRKVLQALKARGLEPFVTLHHFTIPLWLADKGGWTNKKVPEYFERYAEHVITHLGQETNCWMTINEPMAVIPHGYLWCSWPPFGRRRYFACFRALSNMAKAHSRAYKIIKRYNSNAKVGIAKSINYYEPRHRGVLYVPELLAITLFKYFTNRWFLNKIKRHQDFIGLNLYSRYRFSFTRGAFHEGEKLSDFGWEIYPKAIYYVVREMYARYKKPLYITENGVADADDDQRPDFIRDTLTWLHKAIEEGADVRGYFHWSLLDNFEWAEGFTQRFGLVEVNFDPPSAQSGGGGLERKMRPSGKMYGEICKNNGF